MSSSATSDSSLHSRPEKRGPSPTQEDPIKKSRPAVTTDWSPSPQPADTDADSSKVSLPSIASAFQDRHNEHRRASLPDIYSSNTASRLRLPPPVHRPTSSLTSYQFPPIDSSPDDRFASNRPRLNADTALGYSNVPSDYSAISSAAVSTSSPSSFGFSPLTPANDYATSRVSDQQQDHWATNIVRPNSTPGHANAAAHPTGALKYDDSLRHNSLGGPVVQQQLYGGVSRISGHHQSGLSSGIKSEEWTFPSTNEFGMNPPSYPNTPSSSNAGIASSASTPNISVTGSPSHSPQQPAPSSLVERPPRKRGKLPKPVTDFLKEWLHRHSDHPYPSEEEKKQLCNATGLSMSQVSNWMINVSDADHGVSSSHRIRRCINNN